MASSIVGCTNLDSGCNAGSESTKDMIATAAPGIDTFRGVEPTPCSNSRHDSISDPKSVPEMATLVAVMVAVGMILGAATSTQGQDSIGINYGRVADNLPSPDQVVQLLQSRSVRHVRIYDTDPSVLAAFANSGIDLGVTIPNQNVGQIADSTAAADQWVQSQLQPFPSTTFASVAVGNEYLQDTSLDASKLLPAMQNIRQSLQSAGLTSVKVSTPHSFENLIASPGFPPSSSSFNPNLANVLSQILAFLDASGSPFMVNLYPFFSYRGDTTDIALDYALLNADANPVGDSGNGKQYHNLFDAMVDTVVAAMANVGHGNVPVVITESGWASGPDGELAATVANAQAYNNNLVKHVLSSDGTPVRPGNGQIPTFIFALFNEDQKPAGVEQHFGLFNADQSPVYDVQLTSSSLIESRASRIHGAAAAE